MKRIFFSNNFSNNEIDKEDSNFNFKKLQFIHYWRIVDSRRLNNHYCSCWSFGREYSFRFEERILRLDTSVIQNIINVLYDRFVGD